MDGKQRIINYINSIEEPQQLELLMKLFEISLKEEKQADTIINLIEKNTALSPSRA